MALGLLIQVTVARLELGFRVRASVRVSVKVRVRVRIRVERVER